MCGLFKLCLYCGSVTVLWISACGSWDSTKISLNGEQQVKLGKEGRLEAYQNHIYFLFWEVPINILNLARLEIRGVPLCYKLMESPRFDMN